MIPRLLAASCIVLSVTGQARARGPLLLPESTPPNLTSIDPDALRDRATRGEAKAAADLGSLYAHGWKLPRDPVEAMRWLMRAADSKNRLAGGGLGLLLSPGGGGASDPEGGGRLVELGGAR